MGALAFMQLLHRLAMRADAPPEPLRSLCLAPRIMPQGGGLRPWTRRKAAAGRVAVANAWSRSSSFGTAPPR